MVYRLVFLSILLTQIGCGQGQNTIYQTLFVNVAVPTIANISPPSSIGQAGHQVTLLFRNNGVNTCTVPNAVASIEASYDNSIWISIGSSLLRNLSNVVAAAYTVVAQGAYPYVRFNLTSFDNVNCRVTGYYAGSVQQSPITTIAGVSNGNSSTSITNCDKFAYFDTSGGSPVIIQTLTNTTSGFKLCSVGMSSLGIAPGLATATIYTVPTANCTDPGGGVKVLLTPKYNLSSTLNVTMGSGFGHISFSPGYLANPLSLCVEATGVVISGVIGYVNN